VKLSTYGCGMSIRSSDVRFPVLAYIKIHYPSICMILRMVGMSKHSSDMLIMVVCFTYKHIQYLIIHINIYRYIDTKVSNHLYVLAHINHVSNILVIYYICIYFVWIIHIKHIHYLIISRYIYCSCVALFLVEHNSQQKSNTKKQYISTYIINIDQKWRTITTMKTLKC